jgi:hypothetical protein
MLYNEEWCKLEYHAGKINIIISLTEEDVRRVKHTPLEHTKLKAVMSAAKVVGDNPVICLSGGIDSQALLHIWHEQKIPYTAVTFDFSNGFNSKELSEAQQYADSLGIPLKVIKLDVMRFLSRDLKEFAKEYNMLSPQFSVHAYFLETIRKLGYTGAVLGGNGFSPQPDSLSFKVSEAQLLDLEKYSEKSNFPVISSFLNFDKDLCIALSLVTPTVDEYDNAWLLDPSTKFKFDPTIRSLVPTIEISADARYDSKIQSYKRLGCKIIPQDTKKNGFEEIKDYYSSLNNTPLAFDRDFRMPLRGRSTELVITTIIDKEVEKLILMFSKELSS